MGVDGRRGALRPSAAAAFLQEQSGLCVPHPHSPSVFPGDAPYPHHRTHAPAEPNMFLAVFIMNQEGLGRLDFIQNVSFKFVELLSVPFNRSADDLIRQQITYRYSSVKAKLATMTGRLAEVVNVVKVKNPSLLLQLPTRRFVHAVLEDRAILIKCYMSRLYSHPQGRLFVQVGVLVGSGLE